MTDFVKGKIRILWCTDMWKEGRKGGRSIFRNFLVFICLENLINKLFLVYQFLSTEENMAVGNANKL